MAGQHTNAMRMGVVRGVEQRNQRAGIDENQRLCFFTMMSATAFCAVGMASTSASEHGQA